MNNFKNLSRSYSKNKNNNLSTKSSNSLRTTYKIDYSSPRLNIFPLSYLNTQSNFNNNKSLNFNVQTFHNLNKIKTNVNNINLKLNTRYNYLFKNACPNCFNENLIKLHNDNKSRNYQEKFVRENNTFLDPLKNEIENQKNRVINIREINSLKSIRNADNSRKNIIKNCQMSFSNDNFFKTNKEYGIEKEKERNLKLFNFGFKYNEFIKKIKLNNNNNNINNNINLVYDKNNKNKKIDKNSNNSYVNKNEYKNILKLQMKINRKKKRNNDKIEKKLDSKSYGLNFSAFDKKRCDLCKKNYNKNLLSKIIFKK